MAQATLKEVKARKDYPCAAGGERIQRSQKYWKLEAYMREARYCFKHKPTDEQVRHFAPQSRSDRASEAAGNARDAASELNEIAEEAKQLVEEVRDLLEEDADETVSEAQRKERAEEKLREGVRELAMRVSNVGPDLSEVESLAEEMGNWRDGMSGTNLENSSKYSEVEDCASELEGIDTECSIPSLEENADLDTLESFADDCENEASELDSKADEIEGISFPGMY